jgi:DNA-binding SARP family transcriptional activator
VDQRPLRRTRQAEHESDQPVPADTLIDALWGGVADQRAKKKLQFHVHKLRRALGEPDRVGFGADGYTLRVLPGELDAERFESLIDSATAIAADSPRRAAQLIREALTLWRTTPYLGLDVAELAVESHRLADRKLAAIEELYQAELACRRHAAIVGQLSKLVAQHPLRERLHGLLITALHQGGRRADALAAYRAARRTIVAELGLEPGPQLRDLERQVLAGEPVRLATA